MYNLCSSNLSRFPALSACSVQCERKGSRKRLQCFTKTTSIFVVPCGSKALTYVVAKRNRINMHVCLPWFSIKKQSLKSKRMLGFCSSDLMTFSSVTSSRHIPLPRRSWCSTRFIMLYRRPLDHLWHLNVAFCVFESRPIPFFLNVAECRIFTRIFRPLPPFRFKMSHDINFEWSLSTFSTPTLSSNYFFPTVVKI